MGFVVIMPSNDTFSDIFLADSLSMEDAFEKALDCYMSKSPLRCIKVSPDNSNSLDSPSPLNPLFSFQIFPIPESVNGVTDLTVKDDGDFMVSLKNKNEASEFLVSEKRWKPIVDKLINRYAKNPDTRRRQKKYDE